MDNLKSSICTYAGKSGLTSLSVTVSVFLLIFCWVVISGIASFPLFAVSGPIGPIIVAFILCFCSIISSVISSIAGGIVHKDCKESFTDTTPNKYKLDTNLYNLNTYGIDDRIPRPDDLAENIKIKPSKAIHHISPAGIETMNSNIFPPESIMQDWNDSEYQNYGNEHFDGMYPPADSIGQGDTHTRISINKYSYIYEQPNN